MNSIKKNFFYSALLTVSGFVFSFITFPHVSRVLGVHNMGIYNFVDGVINYGMLISMLGVNIVGIREIAKNKNNKETLEESFRDIFFLNGLFTGVFLVALLCLTFTVDKFYQHKELMLIGTIRLFFNFLLVEWFFKGVENFKYVTIRSLAVKVVYAILVFILIKNSDDYILFSILTTLMVVFNVLFNWKYIFQFMKVNYKGVQYKKYLPEILTLGCYMLLASMYTSFNVVYLGFVGGETEVGYYTTATKLYSVLLALFSAFTGVMLPRMSALIAEGKLEEFKNMTYKSYDILFGFSFPIILLSVIFAPQIIKIIAGDGYEGAILPMRLVMPLMLIIGYEQILVLQILMPLKKDRAILVNSVLGAVIGIVMNLCLVSMYKSTGSAIVWVVSELVVLISAQYFVKKYLGFSFPFKKIGVHVLIAMPAILVCSYFLYKPIFSSLLSMVIAFAITGIYYFYVQVKILRNEFITYGLTRIISYFK